MSKSDFLFSAEKMQADLGPALCLAKYKTICGGTMFDMHIGTKVGPEGFEGHS